MWQRRSVKKYQSPGSGLFCRRREKKFLIGEPLELEAISWPDKRRGGWPRFPPPPLFPFDELSSSKNHQKRAKEKEKNQGPNEKYGNFLYAQSQLICIEEWDVPSVLLRGKNDCRPWPRGPFTLGGHRSARHSHGHRMKRRRLIGCLRSRMRSDWQLAQ